MNSWDLFDTLVACRESGPAGERPKSLFPIAEVVARVQPEDLIVSDYYTQKSAERALRNTTGLQNKIVVSQHGKYEGVIWGMLPKIDRHHGDNPIGDYEQPIKHGIPAELITVSALTELERAMVDFGVPGLGLACREARLRTWHPRFRSLQLMQVGMNFPALVLAGVALHEFVQQWKIKRVLMSARDCCLWVDLQRDICNRLHGSYEVEYFPSSRTCRVSPSQRYLDELNARMADGVVIVDLGGTRESIALLVAKTKYPNTPGFVVGGYPWRYDESIDISNVHTLTQFFGGGIFEYANTAQHGMYLDWGKTTDIEFDWHREEIQVMHAAFHVAREVLKNHPIPMFRLDWLDSMLANLPTRIVWGGTVHDPGDLNFLSQAFTDEEAIRNCYDKDTRESVREECSESGLRHVSVFGVPAAQG